MTTQRSLRRFAFALVALFGAGAVGLVLVEVGLRVFQPKDRYYPNYPNSQRAVFPSEEITPGVSGVSYFTTNSYGLRGRDPTGDERLMILTIGGSTTADAILDDEESWAARLEQNLAASMGGSEFVWVGNSGIDGLNTQHHLAHARFLLPQLPEIDYVIVHAGINDLGLWLHATDFDPNYLDDEDNWNGRIGEAFRWSWHTPRDWPFYKHTAIWKTASRVKNRYMTEQMKNMRAIPQDVKLQWIEEERERREERTSRLLHLGRRQTLPIALNSFGKNLAMIAAEIRKQGSEPVFMTQVVQATFDTKEERRRFWMGELDDGTYLSLDEYPLLLEEFNDQMRSVAAGEGIELIELADRIDRNGSLFFDGMHYSELGASRVGEAVGVFFSERDLIPDVGSVAGR